MIAGRDKVFIFMSADNKEEKNDSERPKVKYSTMWDSEESRQGKT